LLSGRAAQAHPCDAAFVWCEMNPGIHLNRIWSDNDVVQLKIECCDGKSKFLNEVYAAHDLNGIVEGLSSFKLQVHGGIYDIALGSFGPELGGGAFQVRLHFQSGGQIFVTVRCQSDFEEFGVKTVASEATLHLRTRYSRWIRSVNN
jgi:hypothetical protein